MPEISLYQHGRDDGGVRYGVAVNYRTVLQLFRAGSDPENFGFDGSIDVRCTGMRLPREPEPVREWLLSNADVISTGLRQAAESISQGGLEEDCRFSSMWRTHRPEPRSSSIICR